MAGFEVNRDKLDQYSGQAILKLREAFEQIESIAKFLANTPNVNDVDPLTTEEFRNYTEDEAYLLRSTFGDLEALRVANTELFDKARKLTGLE